VEGTTVRAAQSGDRAALAALVDDFTPTVLGAAYGLCGDWDAAGDVAQEAFATMLVHLGDLRDPAAFPGWLLALVRTAARRQRRPVGPPSRTAGDGGASPEDLVVARDDARRVRLAVEDLPAELRLPMALHYFAELPLSGIAALCDLPLSTVKQRMRVARARLREGMDQMADDVACRLRPDAAADPTDTIRMYTAMRSGDVARVGALLDARPGLVDAREAWTRADSFAHRLPWTRGGTPLLRAVERGDEPMVRLLLERGADPDGACTCPGGERPLWVAAVQHETAIVAALLARGADPAAVAFGGSSALEVARRRGYADVVELLSAAGAEDAGTPGPAPDAWEGQVTARSTGIKAIDLWCPFPDHGLVHVTPGYGLGAVVLVAELSFRAAARGQDVVWTGFVQAPTDLGDVHHALAESDLLGTVTLSMAPPSADPAVQIAALDAGIRRAGPDAFLVVFAETGRLHAVDERLATLSARPAVTLVVAPLDGSVAAPRRAGSPYAASIVFDPERARRQQWPAVGSASWSRAGSEDDRARAERARSHESPALHEYLCQPFHVAEPVTGRPGETVGPAELRRSVAALLPG
jgi:RNA polymerase sigma-70 factor (ECF subfamily)